MKSLIFLLLILAATLCYGQKPLSVSQRARKQSFDPNKGYNPRTDSLVQQVLTQLNDARKDPYAAFKRLNVTKGIEGYVPTAPMELDSALSVEARKRAIYFTQIGGFGHLFEIFDGKYVFHESLSHPGSGDMDYLKSIGNLIHERNNVDGADNYGHREHILSHPDKKAAHHNRVGIGVFQGTVEYNGKPCKGHWYVVILSYDSRKPYYPTGDQHKMLLHAEVKPYTKRVSNKNTDK